MRRNIDVLLAPRHLLADSRSALASSDHVWMRCDGVYVADSIASPSGSKVFSIRSDLEAERILDDHRAGFAVFALRLRLGCEAGLLTSRGLS